MIVLGTKLIRWACGLMDKASDFGSEDCRFESCHGRSFLSSGWLLVVLVVVVVVVLNTFLFLSLS